MANTSKNPYAIRFLEQEIREAIAAGSHVLGEAYCIPKDGLTALIDCANGLPFPWVVPDSQRQDVFVLAGCPVICEGNPIALEDVYVPVIQEGKAALDRQMSDQRRRIIESDDKPEQKVERVKATGKPIKKWGANRRKDG